MSEPTTLKGYIDDQVGVDSYSAVVDYLLENIPNLVHPTSILTYSRMRHDTQLSAILQAYGRAIGRAHWSLDPAGCRDEVVAAIADDLGLPIKGTDDEPGPARRRKFTWAEHLRLVGLYRVYGHMYFEQAWAWEGGRWRLDVVQERMPQTIAAVHLNGDGSLQSVEQSGRTSRPGMPGTGGVKITTKDHRLVGYVREREGSNYFGVSMLRPSYGPWLIKDQMMRVHASTARRFGMGIPSLEPLPGTNPTPTQMAEAQRVMSRYRASEGAAIIPPAGFRVVWSGLTGSVPDTLAFITYLERTMTRSCLCSILDMAVAERGNRSLGETVMDLMILAQQADANQIAEDAIQQLVVPLVDANWGEDEAAPRIVCGDVGADVELTAQDLNWLLEYGGLTPDEPLENWLRTRYGLPKLDPKARTPSTPTEEGGAESGA